jgi:hypothetical protein
VKRALVEKLVRVSRLGVEASQEEVVLDKDRDI